MKIITITLTLFVLLCAVSAVPSGRPSYGGERRVFRDRARLQQEEGELKPSLEQKEKMKELGDKLISDINELQDLKEEIEAENALAKQEDTQAVAQSCDEPCDWSTEYCCGVCLSVISYCTYCCKR